MNCNLVASCRNSYTGKDKSILDRNDPAQKTLHNGYSVSLPFLRFRILGIAIHTRADIVPVQIEDDLERHIIIAHSLNYPFVKQMYFALLVLNPGFHQRICLRILVLLRFSFHLKYVVELMDEHVHLFRFSMEQIRMYGKDTVNVY